jgi:iron complex outermembrane receptor protein
MRLLAGCSALTLFATAAPAWAQTETPPDDAQPVSGDGVADIVVTARRVAESIQDTPISMTALTATDLQNRNLGDLADISRNVPSLMLEAGSTGTGGSANPSVFIRGVGQTDFLFTTDPGVGIYVDDVYMARSVGALLDLADFQRVEVLRGPQGTLFGKNTIGGAINIVTVDPGRDFGGYISGRYGSRDRMDVTAAVDLPLAPGTLSLRLAGQMRNQDGYVTRTLAGDRLGDVNADVLRATLLWTPSSGVRVRLTGDYSRRREHAIATELVEAVGPFDLANPVLTLWNTLVAPSYGPGVFYDGRWLAPERENFGTAPAYSRLDAGGVSLSVAVDIAPQIELKSITAYRAHHAEFAQDTDHSPLDFTATTNDNHGNQASQELRLSGRSFDNRLTWVVGAFYLQERGRDVFDVDLASGLFDALEGLPAALIPLTATANCPADAALFVCAGGAGNPLNVGFDLDATIFDRIRIRSLAFYGQGTFRITDTLSTTFGLRYSNERKIFDTRLFRNASGVLSIDSPDNRETWTDWSPRIGLEYQPTNNVLAYASVSRGFKSGGFNGRATTPGGELPFDPESVWSYEAGLKLDLLDRHLRLNGAVFRADYSNIQLTSVRAISGIVSAITDNAGDGRIQGFEFEATAVPAHGLNLTLAVGHVDAKYTSLRPDAQNLITDRFPKTPAWTVSASARYEFEAGPVRIAFGGDLSHRSSYYNDPNNTAAIFENGVTLLGANVTIATLNDRWRLMFYGTNLSDARYIINGLSGEGTFGSVDASFGRPREFGIDLRFNF